MSLKRALDVDQVYMIDSSIEQSKRIKVNDDNVENNDHHYSQIELQKIPPQDIPPQVIPQQDLFAYLRRFAHKFFESSNHKQPLQLAYQIALQTARYAGRLSFIDDQRRLGDNRSEKQLEVCFTKKHDDLNLAITPHTITCIAYLEFEGLLPKVHPVLCVPYFEIHYPSLDCNFDSFLDEDDIGLEVYQEKGWLDVYHGLTSIIANDNDIQKLPATFLRVQFERCDESCHITTS